MTHRSQQRAILIGLCCFAFTEIASAQLEEIVVTARKREESLLDVPIAITAFSERFVETNAVQSITDVSLYTPSLIAGNGTGETGGNLFLRGIGSGQLSALLDQSVSINIDGAQVGGTMMFASLLDLQRIEVLRGPQALYYGKNSPGGVISITTKGATDEPEASVKAGYETEARKAYGSAAVSGPITDNLGGRLMAYYSSQDGYLKIKSSTATSVLGPALGFGNDRGPQEDNTVVRGVLEFVPSDRVTVTGKLTYASVESDDGFAMNAQIVACPLGFRQAFAAEYAAVEDCKPNDTLVTGDISQPLLDADPYLKYPTGYKDDEFVLGTFNIDYALSDALTLTSLTAYYSADVNMSTNYTLQPICFLCSSTGLDMDQVSEELRLLSSFDSPINFLVGAYYDTGDSLAYVDTTLLSLGGPLATETTDQEKTAWSVFAQLMWDITDRLRLEVGARYSEEEKEADSRSTFVPGVVGFTDYDADNLSPEVTLTFHPTDSIMLFGSYREGFKSGGIDAAFQAARNAALGNDITYDEETVDGFEFGAKAAFLDGSLQASLAIFTYDYEDLQLSFLDSSVLSVRVENVAAASTSGAELELTWAPLAIEGLTIRGAVAYLDAEYDDYVADCYRGQSTGNGCSLQANTKQDLSNTRMPLAPEFSGTVGFDYDWQLANSWRMGISSIVEFSDEYQANELNSPFGIQDSYTRLNATIQLYSPNDSWELAVIGRNLTDEFVVTRSSTDTVCAAVSGTPDEQICDYFGKVALGREVYLELTWRY